MRAGRPRKPIETKLLSGTHRTDRDGDPQTAIQADGTPIKPTSLTGDAAKFWDEWVPKLVAMGGAKEIDSAALAETCFWWARCQSHKSVIEKLPAEAALTKEYRRVQMVASDASKQFKMWASAFPFTPADRARLHLEVSQVKPVVRSRKR